MRPVQLPEIAAVKKPSYHIRRDVACALRVKLVSGPDLKTAIGGGTSSGASILINGNVLVECNGYEKETFQVM
jgi:hypothetical protein